MRQSGTGSLGVIESKRQTDRASVVQTSPLQAAQKLSPERASMLFLMPVMLIVCTRSPTCVRSPRARGLPAPPRPESVHSLTRLEETRAVCALELGELRMHRAAMRHPVPCPTPIAAAVRSFECLQCSAPTRAATSVSISPAGTAPDPRAGTPALPRRYGQAQLSPLRRTHASGE